MQSLEQIIINDAKNAIKNAVNQDIDPIVRWSNQSHLGDLQINAAMGLAKQLGENPRDIAQKILDHLNWNTYSDTQPVLAGPGFINITLSTMMVERYANELINKSNQGVVKTDNPKRIVVDYGGANIAKEMHIGHLRSTVIGDCLNRILMFLGHNTIKQDHLGDWGTQYGMLIEYLCIDGQIPSELGELKDLNAFYKKAQERFKNDEEFAVKARSRVSLLQGGDKESLRAWRYIYDETMKHLLDIYSRLGILLTADDARGESFYNDMLFDVCQELIEKGIAHKSEGALVVYKEGIIDRDGNPFGLIIQKSDGGYSYATTDLAALKYAAQKDRADRVIYVVDARQSQHFQIVFDVCKRAHWIDNTHPEHAAFGTILGKDNKPFKTRSGDNVKLSELLDESISRAKHIIKNKSNSFSDSEVNELAQAIGYGAIKYADLSNNRIKNYVFDWDRMLALEGNTAPYLQYAIARINSLINKSEIKDFTNQQIVLSSDYERSIIIHLSRFSDVLFEVEKTLEPHHLCTYLFELAQTFTTFYENCPVLKEPDNTVRLSRLTISNQVGQTLRQGLELLGIQSPQRL